MMLRLKKCLADCDLKQADLVRATGWSKTQISLTLNTGKFPADAEGFRQKIIVFALRGPGIQKWLADRGLATADLFKRDDDRPLRSPALHSVLIDWAGIEALSDNPSTSLMSALRVTAMLFEELQQRVGPVNNQALTNIEARAVAMLENRSTFNTKGSAT